MTYCEVQVTTHFSFLRGASSPEELFTAAALMGMPALGVTDRNSVGGVVRALHASDVLRDDHGLHIRPVIGCRIDLVDGTGLLVWPEDRDAWARLTRLLTLGKGRANPQKGEKGQCFLHWEDVAGHAGGLVAALVPGLDPAPSPADRVNMRWMADIFGAHGHVCLTHQRRPREAERLYALDEAARGFGLASLATGDVLYHSPDRRMLQDVVTAIRQKCTIDDLGLRRERSADRHLKPPDEMTRRFRHMPHALSAAEAIVERCTFTLRELTHQYPEEAVFHGKTSQQALHALAWSGLKQMFAGKPPQAYRDLLTHELNMVERMGYAPYFLTVNSIVQFARSQNILCQGRGSAANSVICYVLGITSIDPVQHKLLFERFISTDRHEPPDIDVDFEHERREEVIQWIYDSYTRDHAALTAVVSRYRSRGSIREVGKVLGLSEDMTAALSSQVWGWSNDGVPDAQVDALNLDRNEPRLALALELARELIGTPRHLSQHPGGFVLTRDRLDTLIPIEPAAMVDRHVIEWEKADIEYLGFMKVDILGLGMLGCMRRTFDLLVAHKGIALTMASPEMQSDDSVTFKMIQQADTIGTFQIESRAQMSMLPRLKPKRFYDLVIEVAIVRPGPIQGDMVHPYLRRREGKETPEYPKPELEEVLRDTLGVPLFQEQAMKVAIVAAGFTPGEADQLRKAMATFKMTGGVSHFHDKMINGMIERGYTRDFAERTFRQIEGFGSYGFPESHAASFAKIAYASCWMKCHHPDIFCAALLNAQPMGFYAPAQIIRDASEHDVDILPVCINDSEWDTRVLSRQPVDSTRLHWLRRDGPSRFCGTAQDRRALLPLRLGMRVVAGLATSDAEAILTARSAGPYTSIEDVWRRAKVKPAALERLARADAFHGLGLDRRQALWAIKGLGEHSLALFAAADSRAGAIRPESTEAAVNLDPLGTGREVVEDYRSTQMSLRAHPVLFLRDRLRRSGIMPNARLLQAKDGDRVEVAGIILVRQKPGSAKSIFITIEDETGIANAIVWPQYFADYRPIIMTAAMIAIRGRVQREGIVIHLVADRIFDLTPLLRQVGDIDLPRLTMPGDGATHGGTIDPRDRKPDRKPDRKRDWRPPKQRALESWPPRSSPQEDVIPIKSRDFH